MSTRKMTIVLAAITVLLGVAVLVQTALTDGALGYLLGALLVGAGLLRLALLRLA
ncbi:MAG: hypothetical protein H0U90_06795 [Actinobacteria bacterium]|nr:hypothetical protein [Actinomycetota bacterium]